MVVVFTDPAFLAHDAGDWHPESADRLERAIQAAESVSGAQIERTCPEATEGDIELVHSRKYVEYIKSLPATAGLATEKVIMLDADTAFSPGTLGAAFKAAGAVIEAVERTCSATDVRAFCAVRPPGHHAEPDRAMGFCIFNNLAVGAAYALKNKLASRIAIVDWDVHHGNGTQKMFYTEPNVFYISLHQYPYYPGTGSAFETGEGAGRGCTLNLPMRAGSGDREYRKALKLKILPALEEFKPDLLMISAGFDGHADDPLASINLSTEFYGEMTEMLMAVAQGYANGRIVSVLEGGYNLKALADSIRTHLMVLNES